MKKATMLLSSCVLVLGLAACNQEKEVVDTPNEENVSIEKEVEGIVKVEESVEVNSKTVIQEKEGIELDIVVPEISGMKNKEEEAKMNEMFVSYGLELEKLARDAEKVILETSTENNEIHAAGLMKFEVTYQDENVVSILINQDVYMGGARGQSSKKTLTYNLKESKEITILDLLEEENGEVLFTQKINDSIKGTELENAFFEGVPTLGKEQNFYLTRDAVVITFNQDEYTYSAAGSPEISIDKNHLRSLKKEFK